MKIFKNRNAAGILLAERLKNTKADLVLGIPRGGVVIASEIAKKLKLPLDIIVTRKIGAPNQSELALGAIDPDGEVVWDQELVNDFRLQINDLKNEIQEGWKELKRREDLYRDGKPQPDFKNKTVILVDDGVATGSTVISAARFLKRHGVKKLILAVPVISDDTLERIKGKFDETIALDIPEHLQTVGQSYQNFESVSDKEVVQILRLASLAQDDNKD